MPFTGVSPVTKDPPGYDPENKYKDPVLYYKHKEALVAEEYVKIERAKVGLFACCVLCAETMAVDHVQQLRML